LSVILYQSWDTGYVVVSSFNNNLQWSRTFGATSVCWHDTEPFEGDPVGIPISILKKSKRDRDSSSDDDDDNSYTSFSCSTPENHNTYLLYGCFCSIECALAYLFEIRDWNNDVLLMQTHLMAKEYYGIDDILEPAEPAWDLTKFEGTKSVVDFRAGSRQNPKKRRDTKSEAFWITTGIEYHSNTLPEQGYTTLRKQGIAVSEQLHSPASTNDESLLERPLYLQFLEVLAKRNAELSAEECATRSENGSSGQSSRTDSRESMHRQSPRTFEQSTGMSSRQLSDALPNIHSASQSASGPSTTHTQGIHSRHTGQSESFASRRARKDPPQDLELGSLMHYMRRTKPVGKKQ